MAEFSFALTGGSSLQLNGQKHSRSVAEDLISNKQKGTEPIYQKRRRHGHCKTLSISQQVITLSDFYSAYENKYHVMKTSSV